MAKSNPAGQIERLYEHLLALHAANDIRPLWSAMRDLLRAAVPCHRITLFLGHLGMGDARMVYTDPPIENSAAWYGSRSKDSPFNNFIWQNRRLKHYRFCDVLPPRQEFLKTPFAKRVAKKEGWDKGISFLFWDKSDVKGMFSLYRSARQPEYSDAEIRLLRQLYPFLEIALDRVSRVHSERQHRRGLEEFNKRIPIGLVLLDWELQALFANEEAQKKCLLWHQGESEARAFNARDVFAVPEELLSACEQVKDRFVVETMKGSSDADSVQSSIAHPKIPGLRATVSLVSRTASSIAKPRLLVLLEHRATGQQLRVRSEAKVALLARLTPSEKELVEQVCHGLSNRELAERLCKSILTVKTQLSSVFQKLGVANRSRLISMLK